MKWTYTIVFDPDPDGGFVVTCPALPGLVTHGETIEEAREMARDAMEGFVGVLLEDGEKVPDSDPSELTPRYDRLAHSLRDEPAVPILEQISTSIVETA
jgi:predicted RNase H-like HicB family nuclease